MNVTLEQLSGLFDKKLAEFEIKIDKKLEPIQKDIKEINSSIGDIRRLQGKLVESALRRKVAELYGKKFCLNYFAH